MHTSNDVSPFISPLLARCIGVRAIWSIGHEEGVRAREGAIHELLAFADRTTLLLLRKSIDLHRLDVAMRVVVDGDHFEYAWGLPSVSGSLARWAWRQASPHVAYYDESRWAERGANGGRVVRVRRKALLVWDAAAPESTKFALAS